MINEKWEFDEDLRVEIEDFLDEKREIYSLPDRFLFQHLMGVK